MGAAVVTVLAVVVMLLAGVTVVGLRLVAAVRQLLAALERTRDTLQPVATELKENGEIAGLEMAQLQASLEALDTRRQAKR
jgi:predicted PurR-regulated permease PerM